MKLADQMPGWAGKRPVWGYHGDDGKLYAYNAAGKQLEDYKPWTYGQVVGCGIDFEEKSIFYTVDGERLSESQRSMDRLPLMRLGRHRV